MASAMAPHVLHRSCRHFTCCNLCARSFSSEYLEDENMDNAEDTEKKRPQRFGALLREEHNVLCVFQCPCLPATTMLDLGVWIAFSKPDQKIHLLKRQEFKALCHRGSSLGKNWRHQVEKYLQEKEAGPRPHHQGWGWISPCWNELGHTFKAPSPETEEFDEEEDEEVEELSTEESVR